MINRPFQRSLACLALSLLLENATAQLSAPAAGIVRRRDGAWRRLEGIAGSYVLGPEVSAEPTLAATFDATGGVIQLAAQGSTIAIVDTLGRESARFETPSTGPAILGARLAYFASDGALWSFTNAARRLPLNAVDGAVIAIGGSAKTGVVLAVRRHDGVWRLRIAENGSVASQEALPVAGSVLLLSSGVLYTDGSDVVYLDDLTRMEKRWTLGGAAAALAAIAGSTYQAFTDGGSYAIRLDRDRAYAIPEASAPESNTGDPQ